MKINDSAFCLKRYVRWIILAVSFYCSSNVIAGLNFPGFGVIENEFWVTWGKTSFSCELSLNTEQNLQLTVTPIGQGSASPPSTYILHSNLIQSLAILVADKKDRSKYVPIIIALVASVAVLPVYPHSPDLTRPTCAEVAQDETGFHVSLSGLTVGEASTYSIIDITSGAVSHNYNVTINGLDADGLSETLLVQFQDEWVVTKKEDEKVDYTWFKPYPGDKSSFFSFGAH